MLNDCALQSANFLIDPADAEILAMPAAYADNRIHDVYTRLRTTNPLGLAELPGYDPFWVATKYEDLEFIGKNGNLFHYGDRFSVLTDKRGVEAIRAVTGKPYFLRALTGMDAPDHMKYRLLTQSWFMPSKLKKIEMSIRDTARASVEQMVDKGGHCDFAADIALAYPLKVIMQILGVPSEDFPLMLALTQKLFAPNDADMVNNADAAAANIGETIVAASYELSAYFEALVAARRIDPKDDLATLLAFATVDGATLTPLELMGYFVIIATAGHDTTSSSTGAAMRQLAQDPALFRQVKNDMTLLPGLVEEAIRWETPVKHFMRSVVQDVEIRGRQLRANDWLMVCYASANRDEDVFENPHEFRIDRPKGKNMAFGAGAHVCLGQHLAKLEMRVLLEEMLPRLDSIELSGKPTMIESIFVNGPKSIPVRYSMR